MYCDVESKWKNYRITTFLGQSLSKTGLSLEEAMDVSRDRLIEEEDYLLGSQVVKSSRSSTRGEHDYV
jgi:hypothetical protein